MSTRIPHGSYHNNIKSGANINVNWSTHVTFTHGRRGTWRDAGSTGRMIVNHSLVHRSKLSKCIVVSENDIRLLLFVRTLFLFSVPPCCVWIVKYYICISFLTQYYYKMWITGIFTFINNHMSQRNFRKRLVPVGPKVWKKWVNFNLKNWQNFGFVTKLFVRQNIYK